MKKIIALRKKLQIEPRVGFDRQAFRRYCVYATNAAIVRSKKRGQPCNIDPDYLDQLFVDNEWRCAVTGIPFDTPGKVVKPFGPGLDRIVPKLGYIKGNVRIVLHMVNCAMMQWGEEPLRRMIHEARIEQYI